MSKAISKKISIGVSGRIRQILPWESKSKCIEIDEEKNMIGIHNKNKAKKQVDFYKFNKKIFTPENDNNHVFEQLCKPLCDNILSGNGYNSLLIAYGQTGSGKTHTLLGKKKKNKQGKMVKITGVLPMMIQYLQQNCDKVTLSAIEVYGIRKTKIQFYDLFDANKSSQKLWDKKKHISLTPSTQDDKIWNVKSVQIDNDKNSAAKQVSIASKNAHFAATAKNPNSSRGHIAFIVTVHKNNTFNHLVVMDLAGSEGISALPRKFMEDIGEQNYKTRKMEAGIINCGLGAIQKLLKEVATKTGLSAVRGNGVRKLLYPFLEWKCKPMINIIFTFSPSKSNMESTRNTFRISKLISNLKIIPMKIKENQTKEQMLDEKDKVLMAKDLMVEKLNKEITDLKEKLRNFENDERLVMLEQQLDEHCGEDGKFKDEAVENKQQHKEETDAKDDDKEDENYKDDKKFEEDEKVEIIETIRESLIKTQESLFLNECVDCSHSYWRSDRTLVLCEDKGTQTCWCNG